MARHLKYLSLILPTVLASCGLYRPTHFAPRPPITAAADMSPIPLPEHHESLEPVRWSDLYVRRPVVQALLAAKTPRALDVNAWDEVPSSSWFSPAAPPELFERWRGSGPPQGALQLMPGKAHTSGDAIRIKDERGVSYELEVDPAKVPNSKTVAGPIVARLLSAIGYYTPPVHRFILEKARFSDPKHQTKLFPPEQEAHHQNRRVVISTEWPLGGFDLGPTSPRATRADDPNDQIPHEHRRTLRALLVFASWLDIGGVGVGNTRDVYLGPRGGGHVKHFLVKTSSGLGAHSLLSRLPYASKAGIVAGSPLTNLLSLGFSTQGFGASEVVHEGPLVNSKPVSQFSVNTPYEPFDELRPDDIYWALKRITSLSPYIIGAAVKSGGLSREEQAALIKRLWERTIQLENISSSISTPIEYEGIADGQVILQDTSVSLFKRPPRMSDVKLYDASGELLARSSLAFTARSALSLRRLIGKDYLVVRIQTRSQPAPRPTELHFHFDPNPRLVGIIR